MTSEQFATRMLMESGFLKNSFVHAVSGNRITGQIPTDQYYRVLPADIRLKERMLIFIRGVESFSSITDRIVLSNGLGVLKTSGKSGFMILNPYAISDSAAEPAVINMPRIEVGGKLTIDDSWLRLFLEDGTQTLKDECIGPSDFIATSS